LTVLLSPIIGRTIFDLRNTGMTLPGPFAMAIAAQAAVATLCFIAAARKYRSSESIGTDTVLGLCFVIIWTAVSFAGLRAWEEFRPRGWSPVHLPTEAQVVASLVAGMVVALCAIAANALERVRFRRHEALHDPAPIRRPWSLIVVIVSAAAALLLIPFAPQGSSALPVTPAMLAGSAAVIVIFLLGAYFLFDWCYLTLDRAGWPTFVWLLLTWGGPIAMDLIRYGLAESSEIEPIAGIATLSPPGALIAIWTGRSVNVLPGIIMQALIAAIPLVLSLAARARRRRELATV
jgi:hypothetical protein